MGCVLNASEGRDAAIVAALSGAIRAVPGARLLHVDSDFDHNRTVFTFSGLPRAVAQAAFACVREARDRIDLTKREGVHPRRGAADVVPFVPLQAMTLPECARHARRLADRIEEELGIPTLLYDAAARDGRSLPEARRQAQRFHPTAGATAVGARGPVITFNVQLESDDLEAAQGIATHVGALPTVRAQAFPLASRGCVQVSMSLLDYERTSPGAVFKEVERLARERGIAVRDSEVVGMIPPAAVTAGFVDAVRCAPPAVLHTGPSLLDSLGSEAPVPAACSAVAYGAAMAAALVAKACRVAKPARPDEVGLADELCGDFEALVEDDARGFRAYLDVGDIRAAIDAPIAIAERANALLELIVRVRVFTKPAIQLDLDGARRLAEVALRQAVESVEANLKAFPDESDRAAVLARLSNLREP